MARMPRRRASLLFVLGVAISLLFPGRIRGEEPGPRQADAAATSPVVPIALPGAAGFKLPTLDDPPLFKDEVEQKATKSGKVHAHGLVATINYEEFEKVEVKGEEELVLAKRETGFLDDFRVRCLWQRKPVIVAHNSDGARTVYHVKPAPLAILLLGFSQESNDKLAHTWMAHLYEAGCHVVTFDSVIRKNVNEVLGHGVAGHFAKEGEIVARIVDTVMAQKTEDGTGAKIRERVQSVRFLGTSYGGVLALHALRQPQAKSWPADRVLVLSVPVSMKTAAQRLTLFNREDRPKFGPSFLKLLGGYTPKQEQPDEREESLMRAGMAYVFHGDLAKLVKSSDERYMPGTLERYKALEEAPSVAEKLKQRMELLKKIHDKEMDALREKYEGIKEQKRDEYDREKQALKDKHVVECTECERRLANPDDWAFEDYVNNLLAVYWKMELPNLYRSGELDLLMAGAPNFVQAVIAADDPLNDPKELEAVKQKVSAPNLLVLPHGGHLGYAGTKWVKAHILRFFK
ncbi:MAG: hypothetical protein L6R28_09940 [Planctomycetes bacterium]|nr:hypothetical protein [Planctomycetota bacterium]